MKGRPRAQFDERLAINMRKGCFSIRQIAKIMGASEATISKFMRDRGIKPRIGLSKMRNAKHGIKEIYAETLKRRFAWLPDEYREMYFHLTENGKMPAAEAKAATLNHIERDRVRNERAAA